MSMDVTEEVVALSKPMEVLLQEPGVHLPATIQLVVYTMSYPPFLDEVNEKN